MRLLIVDRDGVINEESADFIKSPSEWVPIPGSLQALGRATQAGFRIAVVSNQSGLARGLFTIEQLNQIHAHMQHEAAHHGARIDAIFFCPHDPSDNCDCRKPRTGLLTSIHQRTGFDLGTAVMIGDRLSDIDAALAVGARPILVETGHGSETKSMLGEREICICADLAAAISLILSSP